MSESPDKDTLLKKALELAPDNSRDGDWLAAAVNGLADRLQPASGLVRHAWTCSAADAQIFPVNAMFPLVAAWARFDAGTATDLAEAALDLQREDGFIPARFNVATGTAVDVVPAWPLLAQSACRAWRVSRDPAFAQRVVPPLIRYVTWCLKHFHRDACYAWTCAEEALIPERFSDGAASADLTALLLCEIQAVDELSRAADASFELPNELAGRRDQLIDSLEGYFWNPETRTFQDRGAAGEGLEPITLSALLPLLWDGLPAAKRKPLLARVGRSRAFGSGGPVTLWAANVRGGVAPPRRAFHQVLVIEALERSGAQQEAQAFRGQLRRRFAEIYRASGALSDELGTGAAPAEAAPALALLSLSTAQPRTAADAAAAGVVAARARPRLVVAIACATLLLLAGYVTGSSSLRAAQVHDACRRAERAYAAGDYEKVVSLLQPLDRNRDAEAEHTLGKALFHLDRLQDAERCFRTAQSLDPQRAQPWLNCGLCLFRQNRLLDAARMYASVQEEFASTHPDIVERARIAEGVARKQLASGSR